MGRDRPTHFLVASATYGCKPRYEAQHRLVIISANRQHGRHCNNCHERWEIVTAVAVDARSFFRACQRPASYTAFQAQSGLTAPRLSRLWLSRPLHASESEAASTRSFSSSPVPVWRAHSPCSAAAAAAPTSGRLSTSHHTASAREKELCKAYLQYSSKMCLIFSYFCGLQKLQKCGLESTLVWLENAIDLYYTRKHVRKVSKRSIAVHIV